MKSVEEVFEHHSKRYQVKGNFEDRVFAKINRKKALRRAKYSSMLLFSLFLIVYLIFSLFPGATREESREGRYAADFSSTRRNARVHVKEEVPVMENVFFASFDDRTDYAIEQVILTEEQGI